jgi:hypothetical protein
MAQQTDITESSCCVAELPALIARLYEIVDRLEALFPGRKFTPDGILVGSIGEALAEYLYDLDPLPVGAACHDCITKTDRRKVQIKFTTVAKDSYMIPLRSEPEQLIVLKLENPQHITEVYNGLGKAPWTIAKPKLHYRRISVSALRRLHDAVLEEHRIPMKRAYVNRTSMLEKGPDDRQGKAVQPMSGLEALTHFVESHNGEYTKTDIKTFLKDHAPSKSVASLDTLILNATTNVKRRTRAEWGTATYEKNGYNLLFRLRTKNLYRRYADGVDPAPVVP